jgi:hypothetical protein
MWAAWSLAARMGWVQQVLGQVVALPVLQNWATGIG